MMILVQEGSVRPLSFGGGGLPKGARAEREICRMWLGDFGVNLLVTETVVDIVGFPVHSLHLFCEGSASPYAAFVNISPNPPPP